MLSPVNSFSLEVLSPSVPLQTSQVPTRDKFSSIPQNKQHPFNQNVPHTDAHCILFPIPSLVCPTFERGVYYTEFDFTQ